jgi:hypothetical protein
VADQGNNDAEGFIDKIDDLNGAENAELLADHLRIMAEVCRPESRHAARSLRTAEARHYLPELMAGAGVGWVRGAQELDADLVKSNRCARLEPTSGRA